MSNPLPYESELIQKLKDQKISVHPLIWDLLSHHILNDLQVIYLGNQLLTETPLWIHKTTTFVIKILYKIHYHHNYQPLDTDRIHKETLQRVSNIEDLMKRVKQFVPKERHSMLKAIEDIGGKDE